MDIYQALQAVRDDCPNPYAVTYAKAVPQSYREYGDEGVTVQINYILSNLDDDEELPDDEKWNDPIAQKVITVLQTYKEGDWLPIEKRYI